MGDSLRNTRHLLRPPQNKNKDVTDCVTVHSDHSSSPSAASNATPSSYLVSCKVPADLDQLSVADEHQTMQAREEQVNLKLHPPSEP